MKGHSEIVLGLIAACNRKDLDGTLALFHDDALYHNMPMAPVRGHAAIRGVLGPFLAAAREVDWIVHHIAESSDGAVLTERTDRFLLPSGWLELPVMGTFDIDGGKIRAWRDYFDMAPLQPFLQMSKP